MEDRKDKILDSVITIPTGNLVNFIIKKEVSLSEVIDALEKSNDQQDKINELKEKLEELSSKDEDYWISVMDKKSKESLDDYLKKFPNGNHIDECKDLLRDMPWLEAKQINTIDGYRNYLDHYPGIRDLEVNELIENLCDDRDWEEAEARDTYQGFKKYIKEHPKGKHISKANNAIKTAEEKKIILERFVENKNNYTPYEIKEKIENHYFSWDDLSVAFNEAEIEAIQNYTEPAALPYNEAPDSLQKGSTEVYFWGTPSSGKTCALGAILSAANRYGILYRHSGSGRSYMDILCNLFITDGVCVFPQGTPDTCIQEMIFSLRDKNNRDHKISCIDLAGELFRAIYRKQNELPLESHELEKTLEKTLSYLRNTNNKKIHFFIVAYNEHDKKWDNLSMENYLSSTMEYLETNKIIKKETNGVYVLVTKSDKMLCSEEERKTFAIDYVKNKMPSFYGRLSNICRDSGVKDFDVLPFSVGNVFAQKMCNFESKNTDIILNKLILKTPVVKKNFWWKFLKS